MPNAVGFVDNTTQFANRQLLQFIRDFIVANGWTILEQDLAIDGTRYFIARGPGYIGPDGQVYVYIGMRSYDSVASDYYNLSVAGFTGYVPGNTFTLQPGYKESGVPGHNQRLDYWISLNDRRLMFGIKIAQPVYETAYVGLALPYANPRQFPYPLVVGGMLNGVPATRFSDTAHTFCFPGNRSNFSLRWITGAYISPTCWPFNNGNLAGSNGIRPTGVYYPMPRLVMHDSSPNIYGELDGAHYMTGFDNVVENTVVIGGVTYIVLQDVWRTGFTNYIALRLDP